MYERSFLLALFLTIVIEFITIFFLRYFYFFKELKKIRLKKLFFISALASSLTLPYLWFVLPAFIFSRHYYQLISESLAIFLEGVIYKNFLNVDYKKGMIISFVCNLISFGIGIFIQ